MSKTRPTGTESRVIEFVEPHGRTRATYKMLAGTETPAVAEEIRLTLARLDQAHTARRKARRKK